MISSQEAGQLDEPEIPVPENNEESSREHEGVLMNSSSASAIECLTAENMIKKASGLLAEQPNNISIEESALKDRQYGETPYLNVINLCTRDDSTLLQKEVDKQCFPSTSMKKDFIDSGIIATESDTQRACNSEQTETPLPSNKRFKRSSSSSTESISNDEMNDTASGGDSPLGFETKSNSLENQLVDVTAETTTKEDSSEDDSFNQPTAQSTDSDKKVGSVVIRQSKYIIASQTYTSSQISTEVVSMFHQVINIIRDFCKSKPAGFQAIQQDSSGKKPLVPIQNPQQSPAVKSETIERLSTFILSRINPQINAMKCSDTQEKDPEVSCECPQSQDISPISVAEFSVNNSLLRSRLGDEIFYIRMLLFEDLEMLRELSSLIIMGFRSESEKKKIDDYILCFDIMEEDYTEKVKLFKNIKKDVKSEKEKRSYKKQLLQVKDVIKVINKCIMYVECGIHLLKKLYENIEEAKQSTSGKSHKH